MTPARCRGGLLLTILPPYSFMCVLVDNRKKSIKRDEIFSSALIGLLIEKLEAIPPILASLLEESLEGLVVRNIESLLY